MVLVGKSVNDKWQIVLVDKSGVITKLASSGSCWEQDSVKSATKCRTKATTHTLPRSCQNLSEWSFVTKENCIFR